LKEKGISVSVDDFGTGYSSLSYLRNFPLDALKIDRSFVQHLGDASHDRAIVRSIISLGQSLHLRVVAEGIETLQDLNFLKDQGCDEGQGYYFFRPLPALQFAGLLVRSTN
jgi:EAL domain-containing protein (putative c-di-GMP-specific phosphodiesterase class I)